METREADVVIVGAGLAGKVHWAGTETETVWNGYMDGAVRSGERAAMGRWRRRAQREGKRDGSSR